MKHLISRAKCQDDGRVQFDGIACRSTVVDILTGSPVAAQIQGA